MQNRNNKTYILYATAIQQMYHGHKGNTYLFIFMRYYVHNNEWIMIKLSYWLTANAISFALVVLVMTKLP